MTKGYISASFNEDALGNTMTSGPARTLPLIAVIFTLVLVVAMTPSTTGHTPAPIVEEQWYDDWSCDVDGNRVEDRLDQFIAGEQAMGLTRAAERGFISLSNLPLFIDYDHPPTTDDVDALKSACPGAEVDYVSTMIDTVAIQGVRASHIDHILTLEGVVMIEYQGIYVPLLDTSVRAIKANPSDEYSPETAWEFETGYQGDGIVVAVLDTGVDDSHPALRGKFVAGVDFTDSSDNQDGTNNPDDADGHGTHCAGTVMGAGNADGTHKGVAPQASLVDLKVLQDWGVGGDLLNGIEWCTLNKDDFSINVLSISIGEFGGGDDDGNGANARAAQQATEAGLVVVAAIGNDGNSHVGISQPASADNVIAVGAIDDMDTIGRGDDEIADFSQSGPRRSDGDGTSTDEYKPDVVAPGVGIDAAAHSRFRILIPAGDVEKSGTSMACPHVAGICALMIQANPNLNPSQIQEIMRLSSEPKGTPHYTGDEGTYSKLYGFGMVDAYNALKMGAGDYQEIHVTSPTDGAYVWGNYEIAGTAADLRGSITQVEVSTEEGAWDLADGTNTWSYTWDTTGKTNGATTIKVRSTNDRSTQSQTFTRACIVNNIRASITTPAAGSNHDDFVSVEGTLDGFAIEGVQVGVDNGGWADAVDYSPGADWTVFKATVDLNEGSVTEGSHTINVRVLFQGNWIAAGSIAVTVEGSGGGGGGGGIGGGSDGSSPIPGFLFGEIIAVIIIVLVAALILYGGYRKR